MHLQNCFSFRSAMIATTMLMFILLTGIGCKKETSSTPYTNYLTYRLDGNLQTVNDVSAALINSGNMNYIAISANTTNPSQFMNLWIESSSQAGTYTWGDMGSNYVMKYSNSVLAISFTAKGNSLIISKHDKSNKIIEGSFTGTVYDNTASPTDSMMISEAIFKIQY